MSVVVTGASDDLIEIGGDIVEEFQAYDGEHFVGFSDGTLLRVEFTRAGVWRITPVVEGSGSLAIVQAPEGDEDNYTDRAELVPTSGPITWVMHGTEYVKAKVKA